MRYLTLFTLLFFTGLFLASCEDEVGYINPSIEGEFIKFSVDGQSQEFKAVETASVLSVRADEPARNTLSLSRTSADGLTKISISASGLPVTKQADQYVVTDNVVVPTNVKVTSTEMSGSIYCPHYEGGDEMTYEGTLRISKIGADGIATGTFSSQAKNPDVPSLSNGAYRVKLQVVER